MTSDAAQTMVADWRSVLAKYEIPYFHMVDCAHGVAVFSDMSKATRANLVRELIDLIKQYTLEGFSVVAKADAFNPSEDGLDAYSHCVDWGMTALRGFLQMARIEGDVVCFFETGHESRGRAYNLLAKRISELSTSLTFAEKEEVPLLQAADLLAWQTTKYVKDGASGVRPPRKDFLSLMEHPHMFSYITVEGDTKSVVAELWPLSRRSAYSSVLRADDSGPIVVFTEDDEPLPIVLITETDGCRMGPVRIAYIRCKDMSGREFVLGFDEPRLYEALSSLFGTTQLYQPEDPVLVVPGDEIELEKIEDQAFLMVRSNIGSKIALPVSSETIESLSRSISSFLDDDKP